jgi:hypothetical protein
MEKGKVNYFYISSLFCAHSVAMCSHKDDIDLLKRVRKYNFTVDTQSKVELKEERRKPGVSRKSRAQKGEAANLCSKEIHREHLYRLPLLLLYVKESSRSKGGGFGVFIIIVVLFYGRLVVPFLATVTLLL